MKIVSGGQTGADRAALDFAMEHGIPHGGWCPRGRRAEDGAIPACYDLKETPSDKYEQRTEWNVRDADATVVFSQSGELSGGSRFTQEMARKWRKPCLILTESDSRSAENLKKFITDNRVSILNVAGPRQSKAAQIGYFVRHVLMEAIL